MKNFYCKHRWILSCCLQCWMCQLEEGADGETITTDNTNEIPNKKDENRTID